MRTTFFTEIVLFLFVSSVAHAQRWPDERRAGPFVIHANFSLQEIDTLIQQLALLQRDVERALEISAPDEDIHLFLFQQRSTYEQYVDQYFPDVPSRRALFIKKRGPGMVFAFRSRELAVDLRHECTHALLHAQLDMVPLWLDEGIAEYFEVAPDQRAFGSPHLSSIRWKLRLGQMPAIERLERLANLQQMGRSEYRDAWAWTHFMLHGPEPARTELVRFLRDIQMRNPPGQLSTRLQRNMAQLDDAFRQHYRNWPSKTQ
jgi:hypothetical protein